MKAKKDYGRIFSARERVKVKQRLLPVEPKKLIDQKIKFKGRVLDFGCLVESENYRKTLRDGGQYHGFDIEQESVKWLQAKGFYVDFWKCKEKFDLVVASQVYEHLPVEEREDFLKKAGELLAEGGRLVIDYPFFGNLNAVTYWQDRSHETPPAVEDEVSLVELYGLKAEAFLVGISFWPPYYFLRLLANLILGFPPQHTVVIIGQK